MRYAFAVTAHDQAGTTRGYYRTLVSTDQAAVNHLRAGSHLVEVRYLRHLVATFSPADLAAIVPGDASTFLSRHIEAGIAALGPQPTARPRGHVRQTILGILLRHGLTEPQAQAALADLKGYVR